MNIILALIYVFLAGYVAVRWNDELKGLHAMVLASMVFGVIRATIEGFFDPTATDLDYGAMLIVLLGSYVLYTAIMCIALLGWLNVYNRYMIRNPEKMIYWRMTRPEALNQLRVLNRYRD
jgi:hypothetical protein